MRVEQRDGYRVIVGGPVPPQADAITLGKTIVVRKRAADHQALMAHELVHVRQFGELGPLRFLVRYVGSYLRFRLNGYGHMAAYRRIPLEVEASWDSRLHQLSELERSARVRQGGHRDHGGRAPTVPRPAPSGGTWSRPRVQLRRESIQAAMAARASKANTSQ